MRRIVSHELLDDDLGSASDLRKSLDDLWRINRWLGGVAGMRRLFAKFFSRSTQAHPLRILDVGAGDGRLAGHLSGELKRCGCRAEIFVLDRRVSHFLHHPDSRMARVAGDALRLPFAPNTFDVTICNLLLHHFSGDAARQLLKSLFAVAAEAVLVNDLDRRWLPYLFIRYAPFVARSPITRWDGAASVRQAYTRTELSALARDSGFSSFEVVTLPCFR
ncbi:MAG TPA: methyltransferase domain-containing protein, partial [Terriglobia bacterium]|nr:methyltransferase domain-containing protein [Terriglobia bacterium]